MRDFGSLGVTVGEGCRVRVRGNFGMLLLIRCLMSLLREFSSFGFAAWA